MLELTNPWKSIEEKEIKALISELQKEIHPNHILFGKKIHPIGRRFDQDDILLSIEDKSNFAIVHLTWSGTTEKDNFPITEILTVSEFENKFKKNEYN